MLTPIKVGYDETQAKAVGGAVEHVLSRFTTLISNLEHNIRHSAGHDHSPHNSITASLTVYSLDHCA